MGIHGDTEVYMGLEGVTWGNKRLQMLQRVTGVTRDYRGLPIITEPFFG